MILSTILRFFSMKTINYRKRSDKSDYYPTRTRENVESRVMLNALLRDKFAVR